MSEDMTPTDRAKDAAARRAVDLVESGMKVGLGTASTSERMIHHLARAVREEGLDVVCTATSPRSARLAEELGLTVRPLDELGRLDIAIDGADEIDANLALIKGGGAALLHEKIVAAAAERMVVIADATKLVGHLGARPLPVEVVPFGSELTRRALEEAMANIDVMGREAVLRMEGTGPEAAPLRTAEGNFIIDLHLGRINDPWHTSIVINQIPGVVENGLFIDMCDLAIVADGSGGLELREAAGGAVRRERAEGDQPDNIFGDILGDGAD